MKDIDTGALEQALAADGEFLRASRLWTGSFAFSDGTHQLRIAVAGGSRASVSLERAGSPADVTFEGPPEGWARVFAPVPPPFYQDLVGGAVGRHGFTIAGDLTTMSAYYSAISRAVHLTGAFSGAGGAK